MSVYLPCYARENYDEFQSKCGALLSVINDLDSPAILVVGDFNANIIDPSLSFGRQLIDMCSENGLVLSSANKLPADSHTFISDIWSTTSWLDHCVSTPCADDLIDNFDILYSLSSSDHVAFT